MIGQSGARARSGEEPAPNRRPSQAEQVAHFAKETVSRSVQILEPELTRLFHRRAISQIHESPGHRTVAEQRIDRKLVGCTANVSDATDQNGKAVAVDERRPRPRRV